MSGHSVIERIDLSLSGATACKPLEHEYPKYVENDGWSFPLKPELGTPMANVQANEGTVDWRQLGSSLPDRHALGPAKVLAKSSFENMFS
uniref:Uncharacterized protein n=1 Tax=Trichuris muris TaxID=70415 RepID=A0A5S6QC52_TRIMR